MSVILLPFSIYDEHITHHSILYWNSVVTDQHFVKWMYTACFLFLLVIWHLDCLLVFAIIIIKDALTYIFWMPHFTRHFDRLKCSQFSVSLASEQIQWSMDRKYLGKMHLYWAQKDLLSSLPFLKQYRITNVYIAFMLQGLVGRDALKHPGGRITYHLIYVSMCKFWYARESQNQSSPGITRQLLLCRGIWWFLWGMWGPWWVCGGRGLSPFEWPREEE